MKLGKKKIGYLVVSSENKDFYTISETLDLTIYDDVTDNIFEWDQSLCCADDFMQVKIGIEEQVTAKGWDNLTSDEKDVAIEYHARDRSLTLDQNNSNYISHLMSKGMTLEEANAELLRLFFEQNRKSDESCRERWGYVKLIIPKYMSFQDATNLMINVSGLISLYKNDGILGLNYWDTIPGIMDYVESTNDYVGAGLAESGIVLTNGDYPSLIKEIKDLLYYGYRPL
jgi:hypothetical protein